MQLIGFGGEALYRKEAVFQKLAIFLSTDIPCDYPALHSLFKYTYSSLLAKYSSADALELFKKLLLNRLLLNPNYFSLFQTSSVPQLQLFIEAANAIRILFYEKRVAQLEQPRAAELSRLLISSLRSMLTGKEENLQGTNIKDRGLYLNDKMLSKLYEDIHDDFRGYHPTPQKNPLQNQSHLNS